jgi:hypothetical protein
VREWVQKCDTNVTFRSELQDAQLPGRWYLLDLRAGLQRLDDELLAVGVEHLVTVAVPRTRIHGQGWHQLACGTTRFGDQETQY